MQYRSFLFFSLTALLFFSACKPSRDQSLAKITEAENALKKGYNAGRPESSVVLATINAYEQFAKYYPDDTMSPIYLIKAGDCYRITSQFDKAIEEYKKVEKSYSNSRVFPYSIFIQGFVYENEVKNLPAAKERYEYFLKKFPNDKLAKQAKFSIDNLGVSPEELVRRFEEKNKNVSDSISPGQGERKDSSGVL